MSLKVVTCFMKDTSNKYKRSRRISLLVAVVKLLAKMFTIRLPNGNQIKHVVITQQWIYLNYHYH